MTAAASGTDLPGAIEALFIDLDSTALLLERAELETPRLADDEERRARSVDGDLAARSHWRATRIALRMALERWLGPDVRHAPFATEAGGRPYLPRSGLHFSMSHTAGAALVAISRQGEIGCDIEGRRTIRMSLDRQRRIIAAGARYRHGADGEDRRSGEPYAGKVMRAWVRLEAVAKASGAGIGRVLTDAGVVGPPEGAARTPLVDDFEVRDLDVGPRYCAAIAAARLPPAVEVRAMPSDDPGIAAFLAERR